MGGPRQKGVVTYSASLNLGQKSAGGLTRSLVLTFTALSPQRQRAFKGVFHGYLFNGISRFFRQAPYIFLPAGVGGSLCLYLSFLICGGVDMSGWRGNKIV